MPDLVENQKKVFIFLLEHLGSQEPFSRKQLFDVTGDEWQEITQKTYTSKFYEPLLVKLDDGNFRVSEAFRKYATLEKFGRFVSQKRKIRASYKKDSYENVIIFEFFMPLANESSLKWSLDALFYKDTILTRLEKQIGVKELEKHFPREETDTDDLYFEKICNWISSKFGGYSITHVNGRFRPQDIKTLKEAAELQQRGEQYLIDETTAVVKFIFPCGKPIQKSEPNLFRYMDDLRRQEEDRVKTEIETEAAQIRWFFNVLFVCNIVELVDGEDEIWMLENGIRSRLHIWRRSDEA